LKFSRGSLDKNGEYVASKQSLYTEEPFGCYGMTITVDFEARLTYDVYFYDEDGDFVERETGLTGKYEYTELPEFPMYARVVIYPEVPAGENNFEIKFYETYKYAKCMDIQVAKKQDSKLKGPCFLTIDSSKIISGKKAVLSGSSLTLSALSGSLTYSEISIEDSHGHELKYLTLKISSNARQQIFVYGTDSAGVSFKCIEPTLVIGENTLIIDLRQYSDIESITLSTSNFAHEIKSISGYYE